MNLIAIIIGLLLMGFGVLFTVFTYGFGILCVWPLFFVGFLLVIGGIFIPSYRKIFFQRQYEMEEEKEIKRICSVCGATQSINTKQCSQCGKKFEY